MSRSAEEWRAIPGYEGYYEVSSRGGVRSLTRSIGQGHSGARRTIQGKMLKSFYTDRGHKIVQLSRDGKPHMHGVHRLMLMAFLGGGEGLEACHNNGIPDDNRIENLRWGTDADNRMDTIKHGRDHNLIKTHCPKGHPYDEANTYVHVRQTRTGRTCRQCHRVAARESARRRAKAKTVKVTATEKETNDACY